MSLLSGGQPLLLPDCSGIIFYIGTENRNRPEKYVFRPVYSCFIEKSKFSSFHLCKTIIRSENTHKERGHQIADQSAAGEGQHQVRTISCTTPHFTADNRCAAPTPIMAVVLVCVVETEYR